MKTTLDIITIARSGVNIVLDASSKTTMDLISIVKTVIASGGHITLKNCDRKTTMDLITICKINPSKITIDLS